MVFMALLACLSHIPGDSIHVPPLPLADKLIHFTAYAVLGFLLQARGLITNRMYKMVEASSPPRPGILIGILHGILDEIHQLYVPLREFSYFDMLANVLGVLAGIYLTARFIRRIGFFGSSSGSVDKQ